ncbi:MAG: ASKHA domain-containing protein [Bacteroidales bacterium]
MPDPESERRSLVTIVFQPLGRRARAPQGVSLLAAAHEAGVALLSVCGGAGLCNSCRVRIARGRVSAPSALERERLGDDEVGRGFRLACQVTIHEDTVVDVPIESIGTEQRLQLEWNPQISADLDQPQITQISADSKSGGYQPQITQISADSESGGYQPQITQIFADSESGGHQPQIPARPNQRQVHADDRRLGLAVDVGTTKIAAYLVDLESRRTLAASGAMNPQVTCGEDLISRIAYADRTAGGAEHLHHLVVAAINDLVARLCAEVGVARTAIEQAVLVGNTVMHHLVVGLPVASLGRAPYAPVVASALELRAADLGLELSSGARAYLPPNIAGYVGADHVAVLVALGEHEERPAGDGSRRLAIDIGTNTEVSLRVGGRLWCCSCASGPAFEGAHIEHGMRAAVGAIERVRVVGNIVRCQTIGDVPPVGICGSGVLDAVSELVVHGAVDRHWTFNPGHPLVTTVGGERRFVLALGSATGHNRDLCLTRRDVSEIQLAKAAIRTGIDIVLEHAGIRAETIDVLTVAGAFGSYLDLASARRVGMLPDLPAGRFRQVGNAAGAGARRMLIDTTLRRAAEEVAARAEHVDLTADPRFMHVFASALGFRGEQPCDPH